MISYSKSALIGAILEDIAYGLYFSYFLQGARIMFSRKKGRGRLSVPLFLTSLVLCFLITMRMVLDNIAVVSAFTDDPITPYAADLFLESFGNGSMFRTGTYIALTVVADIFVVYRVFTVWGGSFLISAVPSLLAIADIVTGGLLIQAIRKLAAGSSPDGKNVSTHAIVFYSFTLALNMLCTLLISLRIYLTQRRTSGVIGRSVDLNTTMAIVIESAALYSVALIAMIVPTSLGDNVQYCLLSMMPGIVGIAFQLIIVRVGSGLSPHSAAHGGPVSDLQFAHSSSGRRSGTQYATTTTSGRRDENAYEDIEIPVHLAGGTSSHEHSGANTSDEKDLV
ncbi:hypothetical protein FB45DRAFT_354690 [Roridomyces roridus]|uniref:Uncharacterized protein n=1 Tax=Roridomyces roridus TaxID=1738132 RepID=A0AAD7FVD0_9AGAR|nr:hypothetical protein FB45DRAFT_354690 [Roridomyces roridus]